MEMMPGMYYTKNIISEEDERYLLENINLQEWDTHTLKRKIQQYGYKYNYQSRDAAELTDSIPDFLLGLQQEVFPESNQVIINHYTPGQGISPHIDSSVFNDKISIVSLNSAAMMDFEDHDSIYLESRSLLELSGYARWKVKHSIPARKTDKKVKRGKRISITFREYNI